MARLVQYHPLKKTPRNSVNTFQCLNIVYITKLDNHGGNLNEAYNASFSNMHFLISGPDFKPTIWTKVPRTVMQYSYFSVFFFFCHSGFTYKTVHPFRNFLAVLSPPTSYNVESRRKFWIHASNIVCSSVNKRFIIWPNKRAKEQKHKRDKNKCSKSSFV